MGKDTCWGGTHECDCSEEGASKDTLRVSAPICLTMFDSSRSVYHLSYPLPSSSNLERAVLKRVRVILILNLQMGKPRLREVKRDAKVT